MPDNSPRLSVRSPLALRLAVALAIAVGMLIVARWPVTTSVGVNYQVTVKRLTLFEKAVAFVDRDLQMRRLAREIAGTGGTPEQRLLRMYEWVAQNVHPVPPGLPVVDDHVLYILVRRYGAIDQRAEALAALATYDGMPAACLGFGKNPERRIIQLTIVRLDDRLVAFDVSNNIVFRKPSGDLATLDDMKADRSIIRAAGAGVVVEGVPYQEHFTRFNELSLSFVRMERQRLWPRIVDELVERVTGR